MTREEIMALEAQALREATCDHLGIPEKFTRWMVGNEAERSVAIAFDTKGEADRWIDKHREYCEHCKYTPYPRRIFPCVDDDLNAARLVEDEVERRGLREQYLYEIEDITLEQGGWQNRVEWEWALLRATPETRCRAALLAVAGKEGE